MEGTKNSDIRVYNRKRMVNLLFHQGAMTKAELVNRLDISLPTATLLLKELTEKGLITKGEVLDSTGGRRPVRMAPVYDIKFAVGVEVSMHEIRMVLQDIGARVHARASWSFGLRADREYWEMVNGLLEEFIGEHVDDDKKLLSVGISIQLPIDHGRIVQKKKDVDRLNLEMVKSCFQRPVEIQNSAKMAAIAQIWGRIVEKNFVFLSLGTYMSGAIIYQPTVWEFDVPNGMFGSMMENGRPLEEILTIGALTAKAGAADMEELFTGIEAGNEAYLAAWEEYLEVLSRLLYNLRRIFGYEIVIGGAICPYLEPYQDAIIEKIKALEEFEGPDVPYVTISDLGAYGAAMGAAMMPINRFLEFGYEEI